MRDNYIRAGKNGNIETLVEEFNKAVLKHCPSPLDGLQAKKDKKPAPQQSKLCKEIVKDLKGLDKKNYLASCYLVGYETKTCADFINFADLSKPASKRGRFGGSSGLQRF